MPTSRFINTLCLSALVWGQTASALELTNEERAFIAEHPTIVAGGEMDWPPMDYVEDGVYKGAAKDYLDEIESLTGLSVSVVTGYSWSELMNLLSRKEIDMVPMMYWTEHRGREFNLTNPYITVRHYVFTRGKREGISNFGGLYGKTMAVPAGYAHIEYLNENHPDIEILVVPSILDAMDAVLTGQADAIIENTASMAYYTEHHSILGLVPAFPVRFEVNNVHMAVRKDWPVLRDILQKALDEISAESTARIMAKWTGSEATAKTFLTTKAEFSQAEESYLKQKGQISACVVSRRMPLESFVNHSHEGMTSEYLRVLSDTLKVPIIPVVSDTWKEIEQQVATGHCDIVTLAHSTGARSENLLISPPYINEKLALATNISADFYESLSDLPPVAIGVVEGYTSVDQLRLNYPEITFVEFPTVEAGLDALEDGDLFGVLDYLPTISTFIRREYDSTLKVSGDFTKDAPGFSFGIRRTEQELASAIAKVVQTLPDSLRQNIHRKWIAVSIEKHMDYRLFSQAALVASIVLLFLLFRYAVLRRHREEMRMKNEELERINAKLEEQTNTAMHMAYHDQLTGLTNRTKMLIDLDRSMKLCRRTGGKLAILFMDLDRFKHVNDSLGHDVGDKLLQAVAKRVDGLLRETDTLCRVGGDEFIVILEAISDSYSPCVVAQRIIKALEQTFQIAEHTLSIGVSIGIAVCPDDSDDLNTAIKYADSAMYTAKENGRNGYSYYHEELTQKAERRMAIETALRRSLDEQNFSLAFQPIVDLNERRVVKAEALLRWRHAELGNIPPDEFIPIAEEFGMIVEIGEWVLRKTCESLTEMAERGCDIERIAINVSSVEFLKGDITSRFQTIIGEYGVRPQQIEIEITERYMLEHGQETDTELQELRRQGHTICVDDFGTGYSSLSYMKRLPLNIIKVDRSFIHNVPHDQNDVEITQAIISLSHSLGYEVVAEGVETFEQLEFLMRRACNYAQGYLFSEPVSIEALYERVNRINEQLRLDKNVTALGA